MFEFLSGLDFITWWIILVCSLMALAIGFAIVMVMLEEKKLKSVETLRVFSVRQVWAMPEPPPRPTPPMYTGPQMSIGGFDAQQSQHESNMRNYDRQMQDFATRQQIASQQYIETGQPPGWVDHYEIEFEGHIQAPYRAPIGHKFSTGHVWRVEITKGSKSGRIYSLQPLERVED